MPDIYEVNRVIHDVREVTIPASGSQVISLSYTPNNWRIYSKSVAFRAGWVSCLPGTSVPDALALKLLPGMAINIPARGPTLSLRNLAGMTQQYYRIESAPVEPLVTDPFFGIGAVQPQPDYWVAQSFLTKNVGELAKIEIGHAQPVGVGTMTWELRSDYPGKPGVVLQSAQYTPIASVVNTIDVPVGPTLNDNQVIWLALRPTTPQTFPIKWGWACVTPSVYPDGRPQNTNTQWATVFDQPTYDCRAAITLRGPGDFVPVDLVIEIS